MNYIVYGEERATIDKKIRQITEKAKVSREEISQYDASQTPLERILEDAMSIPFFAEQKVIVVKNATFLTAKDTCGYELEPLLAYLREPLASTTFILTCFCEKLDQRKKAVKQMLKDCQVIVCSKLNEKDKEGLIQSLLQQKRVAIEPDAFRLLCERLPLEAGVMEQEIEKLALYGGRIQTQQVEALVSRTLDDNVFDLANAWLAKDLQKAFRLWKDLDARQIDPLYLIATLAAQYRFLYQVKVLTMKGLSKQQIAQTLSAHPYRVQVCMGQCRHLSASLLLRELKRLADLEQRIKNGRIDKKTGFELYLIRMKQERSIQG